MNEICSNLELKRNRMSAAVEGPERDAERPPAGAAVLHCTGTSSAIGSQIATSMF